jgi:hypothetical protein
VVLAGLDGGEELLELADDVRVSAAATGRDEPPLDQALDPSALDEGEVGHARTC